MNNSLNFGLAVEHGVSAHVVAASLQVSSATTMQSYVKPEAAAGTQQRRALSTLEGTESPPERETIGPRIVSSRLSSPECDSN